MDPAFDLAPTPGPRAALPQIVTGVVLWGSAAVMALSVYAVADRVATGELVWPIAPCIWAVVVFLTIFLVALAAIRRIVAPRNRAVFASSRRTSGIDAVVAGPIVVLIAISAAARFLVQVVGFGYLHPAAMPQPFSVVATTHDRSHGRDYYRLRLRFGPDGRTFSDRVGRAVYEAARDGDTVMLPVETGRFGLQRAMVATPLSAADLHHPG